MRGNGGRIGPKHTPTTVSASGVWSLTEAGDYRRQSLWPPLIAALYTFTSATFTPGGQTGATGPSLAQARTGLTGTGTDAWKSNTAYFNTSSGVQLWTVPATGTYSIDCYGAQGADGIQDAAGTPASSGGLGARIQGNFQLTEGQVLSIVVGQRGMTQTTYSWGGGGGGGGTFVWVTGQTTNPLVAAGGGGCGGIGNQAQSGGQTGTSGSAGQNNGGAGGTGGNTSLSQGICGGGGGNGWLGGQSYYCGGNFTWSALYTSPNGLVLNGGDGGFGGGAGSWGGGGGGGGYSGGGSGGWSYAGRGGGGGSYNAGSSPIATGATWTGHGQVIITRV